eukprot:PhF_6_TR29411/c0_g1_i1/m.43459
MCVTARLFSTPNETAIESTQVSCTALDKRAISFVPMIIPKPRYGYVYQIEFTSNTNLTNVSQSITIEPCGTHELAIYNEATCVPCPEHVTCNGTTISTVSPGYWRADNYSRYVYACPRRESCLGGVQGSCAEGYSSILCSVCNQSMGMSPGSGKRCLPCKSFSRNVAVVSVGMVVLFLCLTLWTTYTMWRNTVTDVSILVRMLITHLQQTANLGELTLASYWPAPPRELLGNQGNVADFGFTDFSSISCVSNDLGISMFDRFLGYMSLPAISLLQGIFVWVFVRIVARHNGITFQEAAYRQNAAQHKLMYENVTNVPFVGVVIISVTITIFMFYQVLIQQSLKLIQCQKIQTNTDETYYLHAAREIDCSSPTYESFRWYGLCFGVGYAIGIPMAFVTTVSVLRKCYGQPRTDRMFQFLLGGYHPHVWFWEVITMMRKLSVVSLNVFLDEPKNEAFGVIWVISFFLVLHLWMWPYKKDVHNHLEGMSLVCIIVTTTLGLAFMYDFPSYVEDAVSIAVCVVIAGMTFIYLVYMWFAVKDKVLTSLDYDGDGEFTWDDVKIMIGKMQTPTLQKFTALEDERLDKSTTTVIDRMERELEERLMGSVASSGFASKHGSIMPQS